jgi:fucose permease
VGQETSAYRVLAAGFAALALAFLAVPETGRLREPVESRECGSTRIGRGFIAATSVILLYVGAEIGFASWLYEFVNLRFAARTATAVTGTFWAAFTVSRLAGVLAARRWSAHQILSATLAAGLAFTLVLVLAPGARLAVWIGAVGFGAAVGPIYPNVITSYALRFPLTGRRFGAIAVASCTGSMIFPWLIGRLLDLGGTAVVPAVTGGLLAATALAAWAVFRAQPREKLSERG